MFFWIKQSLFRKILVALLALSVIGAGTTWYILSTQDKKSETPVVKEKATLTIESEPEGVTMTLDENCKSDSSESVTPFNCTFSAEKKDTIVTAPEEFEKDGQKYTFSTWDGCSEGNENKRICRVKKDKENHLIKSTYTIKSVSNSVSSNQNPRDTANLQKETRINNDDVTQLNPDIYGDWVVYEKIPKFTYDSFMIIAYNLKTKERKAIATSQNRIHSPSIYRNMITWQSDFNNNNIFLRNLEESEAKTIGSGTDPDIDGNYVVWSNSGNILVYSILNNTTKIVAEGGKHRVKDNKVSYWRGKDIYMYDLQASQELKISTTDFNRADPIISENFIAYTDSFVGGKTNLKIYNHKTKEIKSALDIGDIYLYREFASNNRIFSIKNGDIYSLDIISNKNYQITNTNSKKIDLQVYENIAVWSDFRGKPAIYFTIIK